MAEPIDRRQCPAKRHGSASAYRHNKCRCADAIEAFRRYERYRAAGKPELCPDTMNRIPILGLRRRIQALYAIGHIEFDIARALGYTNRRGDVPFMHSSWKTMYSPNAEKIYRLYNEWRQQPGKSEQNIASAGRFGWWTPEQWDLGDIDDPLFTPDQAIVGGAPVPIRTVQSTTSDPWDGAVCRDPQVNADLWHGSTTADAREAVKGCLRCPIRRTCLRHALVVKEHYGTWGGLAERPRRALRTQLIRQLDGRPIDGSPELENVLDQYMAPNSTNEEVGCA